MKPRVERVDDRLGLAVERASLSGRSLVTYARDHVTVRTPSRPDFRDGNTLDLERAPTPDALDGWLDRFERTIGNLGASHVQVRWETPLAATSDAVAPTPDPALAAACTERGLALEAVTILLLDRLAGASQAPVAVESFGAPVDDQDVVTERRWYASTVLYRYEEGETPDDWRDLDDAFAHWSVEVQRELAAGGRARLWLATRHAIPVGRLTIVHDQQGLATVTDVVVHPAHRRLGIASALTHRAVADHLADHPDDRIGVGAEPGSSADRLYRRLGFRPHATVWTARGPRRG